jgi:NADPH-dependent curcumin reductase
MCGMIAEYNDAEPRPGPTLFAAVRKRLRIQGFIVSDHAALRPDYLAMAAPLVRSGGLKYREDIVEGIDNAPAAFIGLLQGRNFGKLIVKLGADPTR